MSLSDRLKSLLEANPLKTQAGLSRATGAKKASVSDWVNGKTKSINSEYLTSAAFYFGVSSDWLATGKGPKEPQGINARAQVGLPQANTPLETDGEASGAELVQLISAKLDALSDEQRRDISPKLAALALAPDSPTLKKSISESLGSPPLPAKT